MQLPDVNVLLGAFRDDLPHHGVCREWLRRAAVGGGPFGVAGVVLSGVVRISTNPRVFAVPTPIDEALAFAESVRRHPNCALLAPGPRHWEIFANLCRAARCRGNLVADAYLAALAIETGSEWITLDRDFARFPGLRWREPA